MKNLLFTLLLVVIFHSATGQNNIIWPTIQTPSANDMPIELKKLRISVFVVENIATTTYEMQFYNQNSRVMEGELNFPLARDVTVSRFALDVNGELREGVVVEKEKATQAFEAVIRRNIDPGLVEVTRGNNFKSRVYPIPAKGYKKAVIAFEQELWGKNNEYIYQLPLNFKHELEQFGVKVEVVMNKPTTPKNNDPFINLKFNQEHNAYVAEYNASYITLDTHLAFTAPMPQKINKVTTYKGKVTSDNYFYIHLNLKNEDKVKRKPQNISIIWDESSSAQKRNIEKELEILKNYLQWIHHGNIELITFSNTIHRQLSFPIKNGKCESLINTLASIQYDGGTNMHCVDFSSINTDEIICFSDGISNFGVKSGFSFSKPIVTINTSNIADHNLLEYFASESGGIYLNGFELSANEIIKALTHQSKQFIKAEYDHGQIKEFYPAKGNCMDGKFSCAGIAEGAQNNITLYFGYGNKITESHTIMVDNTKRIDNNLGERIWAQKKLKTLLVKNNPEKIKQHGKQFSLVTPGTSLIVLDDVHDYVRYEITPPPSLLNTYNSILLQQQKNRIDNKEMRIKRICNMFQSDINWWETVTIKKYEPHKKSGETPPPPPQRSAHVADVLSIVEDDAEISVNFEMAEEETVVTGYADNRAMNALQGRVQGLSVSKAAKLNRSPKHVTTSSMNIVKWESNAGYMTDLKATNPENLYASYLSLKNGNADNPSFYFDVATYLFQKNQKEAGLRVISNLAELELENTELMRTLARKLSEYAYYEEAIEIFKEVLSQRSFEPHSYIDLGLAYAAQGTYQKAINELYTVISKEWDPDIISRFPGIELIVLHDINNIIEKHASLLDISFIKPCFIKQMPVDIRIVIDWDANETDIDLWVTDPDGEKCSYQNKNTRIGGRISNDITQGYGPEEFRLKKAIDGTYTIEANFYGTRKQTTLQNVTVRATVYTNFGKDHEQKEILTLQLEPNKKGEYTIGDINFTSNQIDKL
ncbi:VIT domain-containing protein [Plebeiibacterium marinum]|uniref:VIT domain-containing protein n=1 Tax=Plebeiibacterium marinum TaxID=2992111 RepID=A0AAE3MFQ3_9BACT|nr:VIT domain-containing protein [Plebeiobacterium marinum]MCW3807013.1 VIT domain-containing protein [Plebeiobacterium marinum]